GNNAPLQDVEDVVEVNFDAQGHLVLVADRGILVCNDPAASTPLFQPRRGTLNNTLIYDVAVDPRDAGHVYANAQDQLALLMTSTAVPAWQYLATGNEVGSVRIDPAKPDTVYSYAPPGTQPT